MNKPKAYSYLRFSTPEQSYGDSFRRQSDLITRFVEKYNLDLQEERFEDFGVSGFTGANIEQGALGQFIKKVTDGEIGKGSWLLIESWDRFSRMSNKDALVKAMPLLDKGIVIATLSPEQVFDSSDPDTFTIEIMRSLIELDRAHKESALKSSRIKAAWDAKKELAKSTGKPITSMCPAWITVKNGSFELIPERADVVRKIYELSIEGYGRRAITVYLNNHDVKPFSKRARTWHTSYIEKILKNPACYGTFVPGNRSVSRSVRTLEDPIENYFPPVIAKEQFLLAQLKSKKRNLVSNRGVTRAGVVNSLFSGLIRCSCGDKMMRRDRQQGCVYYECTNHLEMRGCNRPRIYTTTMDVLLMTAVSCLGAQQFFPQADSHQAKESHKLLELEMIRKDELGERINNLVDALSRKPNPFIEASLDKLHLEYTESMAEIERLEELVAIEEESAKLEGESEDNIKLIKQLSQVYRSDDHELRGRFAHWIKERVKYIQVFDDRIVIERSSGEPIQIEQRSDTDDMCVWVIDDKQYLSIPARLFVKKRRTKSEVIESAQSAYNSLLKQGKKPTRSAVGRLSGIHTSTITKNWEAIIRATLV